MTCSHCGAPLRPDAAFCTTCGTPVAAGAPDGSTVPLTAAQQQSLRVMQWMPTVIAAVVGAGFCLIGSCVTLTWRGNAVVPWVAGSVILLVVLGMLAAMSLHIRNVRADLASGVAQVRVDRLVRTRRKRSGGETVSYSYYAEFERDGSVIIDRAQYEQLQPGLRYRAVVSPRVNRAWTIEPVLDQ